MGGSRFEVRSNPGTRWTPLLEWDGRGCFAIDLDDHELPGLGETTVVRLGPGDTALAELTLASGHVVRLQRMVPQLHVQLGGASVCIDGDPMSEVQLNVSNGAMTATGHSRTNHLGRSQVELVDEAGETAAFTEGLVIEGFVGTTPLSMPAPPLRADVDWRSGDVRLQGIPGADVELLTDARFTDCRGVANHPPGSGANRIVMTSIELDDEGRGEGNVLPLFRHGDDIGEGLIVTHPVDGHRVYIVHYPLQLEPQLGTSTLDGLTGQLEAVEAELFNAEGVSLATGRTRAGINGRFRIDLTGDDPILRTGRELRASAPSDDVEMPLPALNFDWSRSGLDGVTRPNATVSVMFELPGVGWLGLSRRADADGRFAFRPSEIPEREPWTIDDVSGVRARINVLPRHTILRAWPSGDDSEPFATPQAGPTASPPTPTETIPARSIYIPYSAK